MACGPWPSAISTPPAPPRPEANRESTKRTCCRWPSTPLSGRRPPIRVFGSDYPTPDGTCVRDYVHVADIARAHLLALEKIDSLGLAFFNLGSETGYSVRQVLDAVERTLGRVVPSEPAARRPGDPAVLVASAARARGELGWAPDAGLDAIIASAWDWRQRYPRGYDE